jgi:toxin ParE1/3/4
VKKYTLTRKAEQDIRGIWSYTVKEWGEVQAEKYLKGLEDKLEQLSDSPDTIGVSKAGIVLNRAIGVVSAKSISY